ncbi:MAG: hypothetical protein U0637_07435 [Phycisphaerales bacterium]
MRVASACLVFCIVPAALAQPAVVGLDASRGGDASLQFGSGMTQLRSGLLAAFPSMTFRSIATLTALNPATDDVVFFSSARAGTTAITPLSTQEKQILLAFISAGGGALLFVDNDTFAGAGSDAVNESMLDPFGLDALGTGAPWERSAHVANPGASPVTSGPFGTVTSFSVGWTGWFSALGPYASSLATLVDNNQPCLAVIPCNAIAPGSGPVVLFSDSTMISNGFLTAANLMLVRNAMAYASQTCGPTCDPIDFNGDGLFPDTADIDDFLSVFSGGPCSTGTCGDIDFNNDGLFPDTSDIDSLLSVFSGGPCL